MTAAKSSAGTEMSVRRWAVWSVTLGGAVVAVALAARSTALSPPTRRECLGIAVLLVLGWMGQHWRVRMPRGNQMFLTAVPIVSAAVLYGAAVACLLAGGVYVAEETRLHRRSLKTVFNTSMWALMGGAAGLAAHVHPSGDLGVVVAVVLAALAYEVSNVTLVALMLADGRRRELPAAAWELAWTQFVPFWLALSVVPLFVVTWQAHPYLALTVVGPLAAVILHLRSLAAARQAMTLARTDSLTGLGNRRALDERLQSELEDADSRESPLSICLIDIDGFKAINDHCGHQRGDEALVAVGGVLRHDGEAFRLGGDEFVVLLPGVDDGRAGRVAASIEERVDALAKLDGVELSVSAGTATHGAGGDVTGLLRDADEALYRAKAAAHAPLPAG